MVRLDLVGLDWVGLNSPNVGGSGRHVYRGLLTVENYTEALGIKQ